MGCRGQYRYRLCCCRASLDLGKISSLPISVNSTIIASPDKVVGNPSSSVD